MTQDMINDHFYKDSDNSDEGKHNIIQYLLQESDPNSTMRNVTNCSFCLDYSPESLPCKASPCFLHLHRVVFLLVSVTAHAQ